MREERSPLWGPPGRGGGSRRPWASRAPGRTPRPIPLRVGRPAPPAAWLALALIWLSGSPQRIRAQDIEVAARARGIPLPAAYYQRVAAQPDFFELRDGWIARAQGAAERQSAVTGTLPVLLILALHADSPEPWITPEEVQRAVFAGPAPGGTVTEYYREVSGGRFQVTGSVTPWVRTTVTRQEAVGNSYGLGQDAQVGRFLLQALAAVDPFVDFGQFDNDGPDGIPNSGDDNGRVDAVAFEFIEVAASCGGPGIWPHRSRVRNWTGAPYASQDRRPNGQPILVDDYIIQSAVDCGGVQVQNASTIAHELGHVLGLPDLYDSSQGLLREERRWVVGCWSLMAAGSGWGCGRGEAAGWIRPTHMSPWEKIRLGWLRSVRDVGGVLGETFTFRPVQTSEEVLKIPLQRTGVHPDSAEYLLVEYRAKTGFDRDLPAEGVLIYHIDPKISGNRPCATCPQRYRVALVEADGNFALRKSEKDGGNRGEAGDAWGRMGPQRLTPSTVPSTALQSGAKSDVTFYEVAVEGGVARVVVSTQAVSLDAMVRELLGGGGGPTLSAGEKAYLDAQGNRNGRFDVGDLRAYIRR